MTPEWFILREWDDESLDRLERVLTRWHDAQALQVDLKTYRGIFGPSSARFEMTDRLGKKFVFVDVFTGDAARKEIYDLQAALREHGEEAARLMNQLVAGTAVVRVDILGVGGLLPVSEAMDVARTIWILLDRDRPLYRCKGAGWYLGSDHVLPDQPPKLVPTPVDISRAGAGSTTMEEALARLDTLLPERAPQLAAARQPPVAETDLDALRRAVDPHELPAHLVTLLRWSDGVPGHWWPSLECGALLGAAGAAEHYAWLCENAEPEMPWPRCVLPVFHQGWYQAGLELVPGRPGVIVDGSFPDAAYRVVAPSLLAAIDVTANLLELDLPLDPVPERERAALMERRHEWSSWRHGREPGYDPEGWPAHWREGMPGP
jgi:hypothetical protein